MRALMLVACVGCGRLGFAERTSGVDAAGDTTCWDRWREGTVAVGEPRKLAELGDGAHTNPSISADGLTLSFERVQDVYASTRPSRDAAWSTPARVDALASEARDGRFSTSGDGRFGALVSARGGNQDLWTTERPTTSAPFATPTQVLVMSLRTTRAELDPEVTDDGTRIYYAPFANNAQSIYVAQRADDGAFAFARELSELQISTAVADPALSPDETVIAFSSGATSAENDLYFAVRAERDATFGTPRAIPAVNRAPNINDGDIDLSADGCELYFMSDRDGSAAIYVAAVE